MTDTPTAVEEIALELCPECTRELYGASETGPSVGTLDSECSACGVEYRRTVLSSPLMREVVEVLEAMLTHSGVSDVDDCDKFPEDVEAERRARALRDKLKEART